MSQLVVSPNFLAKDYANSRSSARITKSSGSPDSSFYVGQCAPCRVVLNDVIGSGGGAYRVVAHHYEGDGFRRNAFLGRSDTNGFDENLLRGKHIDILNAIRDSRDLSDDVAGKLKGVVEAYAKTFA